MMSSQSVREPPPPPLLPGAFPPTLLFLLTFSPAAPTKSTQCLRHETLPAQPDDTPQTTNSMACVDWFFPFLFFLVRSFHRYGLDI